MSKKSKVTIKKYHYGLIGFVSERRDHYGSHLVFEIHKILEESK